MRPRLHVQVPRISTILAVALMFVCVVYPITGTVRGLMIYAMAAYMLLQLVLHRGTLRWGHILWVFGFYAMGGLSEYWAYLPVAVRMVKDLLLFAMLLSWSFGEYVYQKEKGLDDICNLMLLMAVLLVLNFAVNFTVKMGRYSVSDNANVAGMNGAYMFGFLLYAAKKANWRRMFVNVMLVALVIMILLTGSRKSLLMVAMFVTAFFLFWSRERNGVNTILRIIGLVAAGVTIILIVMNVPVLYDALGNRLESLFRYVVYGEEVDASAVTRNNMIEIGMRMFMKMNPMFGIGLNNYKYLSGYLTYSHNNYIELLCSVGVVGLLIYYVPMVYFTVRAFILWFKKVPGAIVPLTMFVLQFINDTAQVSYYSFYIHIYLGIAVGLIYLMEKRQAEKENLKEQEWEDNIAAAEAERKEMLRNETI